MNTPIKLSAALTHAVLSAQVQAVEFSLLGSVATPEIFGSGAVNLDGIQSIELGSATFINNSDSSNTFPTIMLNSVFTGTYDWIAVGSRINQENDFIQLSSLTVITPIPEPETWAMMLAAMGLLGVFFRSPSSLNSHPRLQNPPAGGFLMRCVR